MRENKTKKLQWFQSRPASITTTKIIAVSALVLNACTLKAMQS
jgi:hypothetical protein